MISMSECTAGGDCDFSEFEDDIWEGDHTMIRPTRCGKCDKVWSFWVYRFDGEYDWDDKGDPECNHEWDTTDWHNSNGPDGAPVGGEECRKCPANRSIDFHLDETYLADEQGNRI